MDKMKEKDPQDRSTPPAEAAATDSGDSPAPAPAAPSPQDPSGERGGPGTDIERRLAEQAAEIARLAADMRQHRDSFQDIEVSLVTRIADVDDDRRQAATRLQRTQQAQREELDERLKRQTSLVLLLLLLFAVAVASALAFVFIKLQATQDGLQALQTSQSSLTTQIGDIKGAFERIEIPSIPDTDPLTRDKINQLSRAVEEITESLERLGDEAAPAAVAPTPEAARPDPLDAEPGEPQVQVAPPTPPAEPAETVAEPVETPPAAPAPPSETLTAPDPQPEETPAPTPSETAPKPEPELAPEPETMNQAGVSSSSSQTVAIGDTTFALQLMGFYTLESLQRFADEHAIADEYFYRQETYQGRPWFVLIHSLHESQQAARKRVEELPPELAKLKIWVRSLDAGKELVKVGRTPD